MHHQLRLVLSLSLLLFLGGLYLSVDVPTYLVIRYLRTLCHILLPRRWCERRCNGCWYYSSTSMYQYTILWIVRQSWLQGMHCLCFNEDYDLQYCITNTHTHTHTRESHWWFDYDVIDLSWIDNTVWHPERGASPAISVDFEYAPPLWGLNVCVLCVCFDPPFVESSRSIPDMINAFFYL